jgi:hypothetical protein
MFRPVKRKNPQGGLLFLVVVVMLDFSGTGFYSVTVPAGKRTGRLSQSSWFWLRRRVKVVPAAGGA